MPKPQGVVAHEHIFAYGWDTDIEDGRYDVCLLDNDEVWIWSLASDLSWFAGRGQEGFKHAKVFAKAMAEEYAKLYPREQAADT